MAGDPTTTPPVPDPSKIGASQSALEGIAKTLEHVAEILTKRFGDAITGAQNQLSSFASEAIKSGASLNQIGASFGFADKTMRSFTESMSRLTDGSEESAKSLGVVTLGVIGAGKAFAGMNFDNLNTFTGQLNAMVDNVAENESGLKSLAKTLGLVLPDSLAKGAKPIADFIKNVFAGADNAMKAERAYLRLAGATGDLGKLHGMTGNALDALRERGLRHTDMINMSMVATNETKETMQEYYLLLGKVPGALEGLTDGQANLTKTTFLALGTGREYKDIVDDVHMAIRDYSASIPEAIKFTEQISVISEKYKIELQDVDSSLRTTAGTFKMFGNVSLGAQNILNSYVGSLKGIGLSGAVSTEILTNMTGQIEKMSMAQKGFLSQQSGGPGGLMGAAHIDNLLKHGKLDEVFEMVNKQLTRQMGGRLVTTEEAEKSQQGGAQQARQNILLRQGPLGQFARSDQEAERIVEMFIKRQQTGAPMKLEDLDKQIDYTKQGTEYAKQTASGVSRLVNITQAARARAGFGSLGLMEGYTGANTLPGTTPNWMQRGIRQGAKEAGALERNDATEMNVNKISEATQNSMDDFGDLIGDFRDSMSEGSTAKLSLDPTSVLSAHAQRGMPTPGFQLGTAAGVVSARTPSVAADSPVTTAASTSTATTSPSGDITIHNKVEGLCLNCGVEMMGSEQSFSVNTAGKTQLRGH